MQVGYVLCSTDLEQILCFDLEHTAVRLVPVDSTMVINRSICLSDLTEIKNIYKRFQYSALTHELEIVNVARLYKKFY